MQKTGKVWAVSLVLCALLILCSCGNSKESNTTNSDTTTQDTTTKANINLASLEKDGLELHNDQCFWVNLNNWGRIRFISGNKKVNGLIKAHFYLADANENIIYELPEHYGNQWSMLWSIDAVSFADINYDGLKEIIIIAEYMTGVGKDGAVPFPVGDIYFQKDNGFVNDVKFDDKMNTSLDSNNMVVADVVKYAKKTFDNTEVSSAIEALKAVMQNKADFFDTDNKKYVHLDTFLSEELDVPVKATNFTVIDMDGDKVPEVVLELTQDNYPEYYEILYYMNGKVYGCNIVYRGLEMLKQDGTYWSSGGVADNRCNKMRFSSIGFEEDVLGYTESGDGSDGRTVSYFINNKPVTAESFDAFAKDQNEKKDVVWCEPSSNNIDAVLADR